MMTQLVTVLALTLYDSSIPGERTEYFSTHNFVTRPGETPANTPAMQCLVHPCAVKRWAFDEGTTGGRSLAGIGQATLANDNNALDWMLGPTISVDGRTVEQRTGPEGGAYPSAFPVTFKGTALQLIATSQTEITVKLRDLQAETELPLQVNKYAGDNVAPDGLEGTPETLKGKPKPICVGAPPNVTAQLVNGTKLICQVHDGELDSILNVYLRGIALRGGRAWQAQTGGFGGDQVQAAAAGGGLYLLGGAAGKLATSPDSETWTQRTSGFGTTIIYALATGPSLYMAGGGAGTLTWSVNGTTSWTASASAAAIFGAADIRALRYVAFLNLWLAAGESGALATSADSGVTWVLRASAGTAMLGTIYGISDNGSVVVIVGGNGSIATSIDGTNWTPNPIVYPFSNIKAVAFGADTFVAVGDFTLTSSDGFAWVVQPGLTSGVAITYGDAFSVVGNPDAVLQTSDDNGVTWVGQDLPTAFGGGGMLAIAFHDDILVAGGVSGNVASAQGHVYADATELEDDELAPEPGAVIVAPSVGMFRLGNTPDGVVTCDPVEGATAADRTIGQCAVRILERMGYTTGDWNAADITALDTARPYPVADFIDVETTGHAVIDRLCNSGGVWWGPDLSGVFRFRVFEAPSGSPVLSFIENDCYGGSDALQLFAANDAGNGLPRVRTIKRWGKNFTAQSADVAAGVSSDRRAYLAKEWREATAEDLAVLTAHLLAQQVTSDTLLIAEADAQDEADREQALFGVKANRFRFVVALTAATAALDLFPVIRLTHSKYGLSGGKLLRVIGLDPDWKTKKLAITGWRRVTDG